VKELVMSDIIRCRFRIIIIAILVELSSVNSFVAQINQPASTRQSSIDAFARGNYEQAYSGFNQLLAKYPKDPLYKYYSGACLVMMKREPEDALQLLQQSLSGASVVRTLPQDALFYLGRAQQMTGRFAEAVESYTAYSDQVGKKAAREQNVQGYIQECENRKGMIVAATPKQGGTVSNDKAPSAKSTGQTAMNEAVNEKEAKPGQATTALPTEYENLLDEALRLQYKADSLNQLAAEQKKQIDNLPEAQKPSYKMKISQNEMLAASYQKSADDKYNEAQVRMNPTLAVVPRKADSVPMAETKQPATDNPDKVIAAPKVQNDTVKKELPPARKPVEIYSYFEILPKGAAYPYDKIKIDPEVPAGLIYRIQLAVFKNPVAPSFFKGITPVYGFRVQGTDKTNYYAGMFRRSADAKKALQAVKETGFRDSFIISLFDKKPVSPDRAAVLENEWGNKSFVDIGIPGAAADTVPPELVFRVEVARSMKPMKPDALETLKTFAGSRGLDILHLSDGNIVYLIGKFITFESAAEYSDLLIRNNYRGAKVVSWLGNKEVPVEIARQLFNNLK
jgi:tetratricopeptide (TPR) repeat protein